MTKFKKQKELQELFKDYDRNRCEIFEIICNYIDENEEELAILIANKWFSKLADVKDFIF